MFDTVGLEQLPQAFGCTSITTSTGSGQYLYRKAGEKSDVGQLQPADNTDHTQEISAAPSIELVDAEIRRLDLGSS